MVDDVDDGRADDRPLPAHDSEYIRRYTGLEETFAHPECGERGLDIGLDQNGVPRQERGDGVARGQGQRVVPRRDHTDETHRVSDDLRTDEQRESPAHAPRAHESADVAGVVPGVDADVEHFLIGITPGLTRLQLDEVEDLIAPREDEVVEAEQDRTTSRDGDRGPRHLRRAGTLRCNFDVALRRERELVDDPAGKRGDHRAARGIVGGRERTDQRRSARVHEVTTISTRWNSLGSLYPVVAIALRRAPTMFIVPSARREGPWTISSNVPT